MKIWICLESLKPMRWAVRYGNKWAVVKKVISKIPLITRRGKNQPKCYLAGDGIALIRKEVAYLNYRSTTR